MHALAVPLDGGVHGIAWSLHERGGMVINYVLTLSDLNAGGFWIGYVRECNT